MIYLIGLIVVVGMAYLLRHAVAGEAWKYLDSSIRRTTKKR